MKGRSRKPGRSPDKKTFAMQRHGGQALLEFVVAMTVILVLMAGLLQIGKLARARTQAMTEARAAAGRAAMSASYGYDASRSVYLAGWDPGPDGRRYSHDDTPRPGTPGFILQRIAAPARPRDLNARLPGNQLSVAAREGDLMPLFHLVHGEARADPVEVLPIVRGLLYAADVIQVEGDACLVWTGDLQ